MLIEFSVTNFRSFRERQTLSMVAASRLSRKENTFTPSLSGEKFPDLLKAIAIYGPNASGKSNLLRALDVVATIALRPPTSHSVPLPIAPFKFDESLLEKPSLFELHFIQDGLRYSFELAATALRVVNERLIAYPKGKEQLIYSRQFDPVINAEAYTYGSGLLAEASGDVVNAWTKLTSPTTLFIAQAVANSSEAMKILRAPHTWLTESSFSLIGSMQSMARRTQDLIQRGHDASDITAFLREHDVPITNVSTQLLESDPSFQWTQANQISNPQTNLLLEGNKARRYKTTLTHRTALGTADIAFEDESEGTKNLFGFWLPWVTKDYSDMSPRRILIVDEIDSSLHPKIVESLVARHMSSPRPSQLIFSTHDTHLMDSKLLRRDQFWIADRDANGATQLFSIHDFKGRQSEDIEKRYYEGRYRGLPLTYGK